MQFWNKGDNDEDSDAPLVVAGPLTVITAASVLSIISFCVISVILLIEMYM